MSRYVDAEYVKAVMLNDRLMQGNAEFTLYVQQVETQVNALPDIDIVRCSECKHWRTYETWSECELWTDDPYESAKTKANDFCSYGERTISKMEQVEDEPQTDLAQALAGGKESILSLATKGKMAKRTERSR